MRTKVLFFVNSYAGGAEKMTLNIASFLDKGAYEVVFYVIGKDIGLISNFFDTNAEIKLIKASSFKDGLISKFYKILREEKPTYVFSSLMPISWRLGLVSSFFPKIKTIIRANNYLYTQSLIQKIRLFVAYRFINKLIVQTDEMRDEHIRLLKLGANKVITLANPVNKEEVTNKVKDAVSPFQNHVNNYVFVGRIQFVKGVDILLDAFAKVLLHQSDSKLYLIGDHSDEPYFTKLNEQIKILNIAQHVVFVGFSDNPYVYIRFATCFVLPSRQEGLPNVVVEALFLGTPVAVTRSVPVISRMVREGVDGALASVDNSVELAAAMIKASGLGRIRGGFQSADKADFLKIFEKEEC